jgi:hypothetical protein
VHEDWSAHGGSKCALGLYRGVAERAAAARAAVGATSWAFAKFVDDDVIIIVIVAGAATAAR